MHMSILLSSFDDSSTIQLFICIPQFEEIFHPYSRYCSEQTNCQDYCKEQDRNSEVFKAYLAVSLLFILHYCASKASIRSD